jgi:uncharacterized repeat protein (TIGR01451 family)
MLLLLFGCWGLPSVYANVTVTPTTWNIVGLDSNDVTAGPDTFQIGARACNTGATTLTNLTATFIWDSANPYINLSGNASSVTYSLAAGACVDFYFPVVITRTSAAFNTTRRYHITVSGTGIASASTPTPRELYVERIISQGRNSINSITGPTTVYVGQTYTYTVSASTATQGYEQLEAFLNLSNVIFQVRSIATTYSAPNGATNNKFYADACGWDNNPLSGTYRSCIGPVSYSGGKAGGTVTTTYTVKVLSTGSTTASTLVLDFSGSSFHYNSDFGTNLISITALPPPITLSKLADKTSMNAGGAVSYTLRLTNTASFNITLTDFVDTLPTSPAAAGYTSGSSTFNGAAIGNPTISGSTLTWSGTFIVPAGQTRDLVFQATLPNTQGTYTNQAIARMEYSQIDTTTSLSDNAPATVNVTLQFPPQIDLSKSYSADTSYIQPGTLITYPISFTNSGGTAAANLIIKDIIPTNTEFKVGSVTVDLGTTGLATPPTIQYTNVSLLNPDPTQPALPPADNDPSWSYQPTGTYDSNVKFIRWVFTGSVPAQTNGSVGFTVRVR